MSSRNRILLPLFLTIVTLSAAGIYYLRYARVAKNSAVFSASDIEIGERFYPGCKGEVAARVAQASLDAQLKEKRTLMRSQCEQTADVIYDIASVSLQLGDTAGYIEAATRIVDAEAVEINDKEIADFLTSAVTMELAVLAQGAEATADLTAPNFSERLQVTISLAEHAVELNRPERWTHSLLTLAHYINQDLESAISAAEAAQNYFGKNTPFDRIATQLKQVQAGTRTETPDFSAGF